ncbi:MAG: hypothetical protein WC011_00165 [Candidatus Paceibacterota bacterium]
MNTKSFNSIEPVDGMLGFLALWLFLIYLTVFKIVGTETINTLPPIGGVAFALLLILLMFPSMWVVSKVVFFLTHKKYKHESRFQNY